MKFYRFVDVQYTDGVRIQKRTFDLIKETPKGYWINNYGFKKWVSKEARKRFAYPSEDQAKTNFIARKKRQISILSNNLKNAKWALMLMEVTK